MFGWLGALGKGYGAQKAFDAALDFLKSDDGRKIAAQQMTGWFGLSYVDEAIMTHLMSVLRMSKPGEHTHVQEFLNTLTDSERAKVRQILGKIMVPPPRAQSIAVLVFHPDGKPVLEGGKQKTELRSIPGPTIEFTPQDPRVIILVQLGRCIRSARNQKEKVTMGKQMLTATGNLLDKTVLQRIRGALTGSKDDLTKAIYVAFGAKDFADLWVSFEKRIERWERELEHKRRLGVWRWLPTDKPATMIVYLLAIVAIIWFIWILATTKPF